MSGKGLCDRCEVGGYYGLPPKDAPDWYCSTVCWWCPAMRTHEQRTLCTEFRRGDPRRYDECGREVD